MAAEYQKYCFPTMPDGSIGPGKKIANGPTDMTQNSIIIKIAPDPSGSYMSRVSLAKRWEWEIDLNRQGTGVEFFDDDKKLMPMDDFFSWLLETHPADHQFIMFNMEFFNNRVNLA